MNKIDISKCPYGCKNDNYCSLYEDDCYDYMDCDYRQLQQYKQCLDEIEEICKENKKCKVYNPDVDIILQKIKKVKGGNR